MKRSQARMCGNAQSMKALKIMRAEWCLSTRLLAFIASRFPRHSKICITQGFTEHSSLGIHDIEGFRVSLALRTLRYSASSDGTFKVPHFRRFVCFSCGVDTQASMLRLEKKHNMCWCVLQSGLFFGLLAFSYCFHLICIVLFCETRGMEEARHRNSCPVKSHFWSIFLS